MLTVEPRFEPSVVLLFCSVHKVRDEQELSWNHEHFGRDRDDELHLIQRRDSNNGQRARSKRLPSIPNSSSLLKEQDLTLIVLQNKIKMERLCDELEAVRRDIDCRMNALRAEMMERVNALITSPRPSYSWNANQAPLLWLTPPLNTQSLPNPMPSLPAMVGPESLSLLQQIFPVNSSQIQ